jgi:hypothetical protein
MSISKAAAMIAAGRATQKNQSASARAGKAGENPAAAETMRASRGAVDAPGKRHRKPPPQEAIDKRMGEPVGKKMGQKNFKMGTGRGRG